MKTATKKYPRHARPNDLPAAYVPLAKAFDNPDKFQFGFIHENGEFVKVTMVDDYGYSAPGGCENATLYVCGHEYGYTHVIHADGECDAHSAWCDSLTPVPADEVPEAYNASDRLLEHMTSLGHEEDYALRAFCDKWAAFYFKVCTQQCEDIENWDLDEAYQYQSNATGSGIVYMGHCAHMRAIKWSQLRAIRK